MSRPIDADALVAEIKHISDVCDEGYPVFLLAVINKQPTIEPKKGKWIQESPFTKPRCSECGESCFGLHGFDYTKTSFCPNCGAKMEEDNEAD